MPEGLISFVFLRISFVYLNQIVGIEDMIPQNPGIALNGKTLETKAKSNFWGFWITLMTRVDIIVS